ncbi:MAG: invasion associated locus B family protein [Amaricoccus sp.]|uniref:invasion associated locus B family protein n=1 Tax=Amaricoccus sp. TaxID=1872485 RepID=UPI0039E40C9E
MTLKAWKLPFAAVALMAASPVLAQSADRVATHGNWSVFVAASPKECYIVSAPTASSAKRDGKPADVDRGDIRLFVSFRPGEKVSNEVSFTGGYPFKESAAVKLVVGSDTFQMAPGKGDGGEWAWTDPSDDSKAVAAMKRGSEAKLSGTSSRGTTTEDRFSLSGFTAAVEEAASRCR